MEKLFLIDAYALIYRAYYAFIKNPRINSKGVNTSAILGFVNTINEVLTKENPTYIAVAFDPAGPTFRHEAYEEYKAQREACPEDIKNSVPIIKNILKAWNIKVVEMAGYEADDVIGTLAKQAGKQEIATYMLTPDKDYGQLVEPHVMMYRPRYGDNGYEVLGEEEIKTKYGIDHTYQVIDLLGLMGDSSDNIPGCPGVGEKTAVKLIKEYGSIENLLDHTDTLKGALKTKIEDNKEKIRFSKFLATIKTDVPIELSLEELRVREANQMELEKLFAELEFKSFTNRILKKQEHKPKIDNQQLDLFAENLTDGQEKAEFSRFECLKTTPHYYQLIDDEEKMKKLCDYLLTFENLSLDTETTSVHPIEAELVGLSFAVKEKEAFYVPVSDKYEEAVNIVNIFKPLYENDKIVKIGQNLKYDLEVLHRYGIQLKGEMFDTMIAHYLIQPELHHNMDYMAEVYLHYQTIHIEELIGPKGKNQRSMRSLSPAEVYEYAAEDADITLQLKNRLAPELEKMGVAHLFYEVEMPLMPVLAEMELNGVCLDSQSLSETSRELSSQLREIEESIYQHAGEAFNISSPKQVGDILFGKLHLVEKAKKTKSGQYVTNEEVLQSLAHKHEIVAKILEYRGLKKLLSTYIDALPQLVNSSTGRIHTTFNQTITSTGRLSSSDPNLQNIPIRGENGKEIRKAFIPEPGCLFFSADYSQIELRVMAHLSGDQQMIEAFAENEDIHAATAAKIFKKPISEVTRDERSKAKRANFGIIYGITTFGLAERLDISREEARQLIEGYFESFPQVKSFMEQIKEKAREQGYVTTLFGRRRYLPDINSRNATVRGFAERNAINAPIQGTAADIIKVAMVRINRRFHAEGIRSKMVIQVHDELNFSVYPDEREKVQQIVIEEMQQALEMKVALIADSGWGNNWLEAH
ncbi:MAG: DNA polymerase I [Prevotella sp.]|nr:DNA polymerase I [Prevotella sp.]